MMKRKPRGRSGGTTASGRGSSGARRTMKRIVAGDRRRRQRPHRRQRRGHQDQQVDEGGGGSGGSTWKSKKQRRRTIRAKTKKRQVGGISTLAATAIGTTIGIVALGGIAAAAAAAKKAKIKSILFKHVDGMFKEPTSENIDNELDAMTQHSPDGVDTYATVTTITDRSKPRSHQIDTISSKANTQTKRELYRNMNMEDDRSLSKRLKTLDTISTHNMTKKARPKNRNTRNGTLDAFTQPPHDLIDPSVQEVDGEAANIDMNSSSSSSSSNISPEEQDPMNGVLRSIRAKEVFPRGSQSSLPDPPPPILPLPDETQCTLLVMSHQHRLKARNNNGYPKVNKCYALVNPARGRIAVNVMNKAAAPTTTSSNLVQIIPPPILVLSVLFNPTPSSISMEYEMILLLKHKLSQIYELRCISRINDNIDFDEYPLVDTMNFSGSSGDNNSEEEIYQYTFSFAKTGNVSILTLRDRIWIYDFAFLDPLRKVVTDYTPPVKGVRRAGLPFHSSSIWKPDVNSRKMRIMVSNRQYMYVYSIAPPTPPTKRSSSPDPVITQIYVLDMLVHSCELLHCSFEICTNPTHCTFAICVVKRVVEGEGEDTFFPYHLMIFDELNMSNWYSNDVRPPPKVDNRMNAEFDETERVRMSTYNADAEQCIYIVYGLNEMGVRIWGFSYKHETSSRVTYVKSALHMTSSLNLPYFQINSSGKITCPILYENAKTTKLIWLRGDVPESTTREELRGTSFAGDDHDVSTSRGRDMNFFKFQMQTQHSKPGVLGNALDQFQNWTKERLTDIQNNGEAAKASFANSATSSGDANSGMVDMVKSLTSRFTRAAKQPSSSSGTVVVTKAASKRKGN